MLNKKAYRLLYDYSIAKNINKCQMFLKKILSITNSLTIAFLYEKNIK